MTIYIKEWHEKALFFLVFRYEKERKAVFYKSHNPKVVSSNLAPATKKSAENTSFSALYFLLFYRKIDFDPNLTPKHQKRKVEQDNTLN
jgi:hypothetical protein